MKTGIIDTKGNFHEIPFYEIENVFKAIAEEAASIDEDCNERLELLKQEITHYSPYTEFCLHVLGWMIYDPFCVGSDDVLFSNGKRSFVAPLEFVKKPDFDRKRIANKQAGFPVLTDKKIKFEKDLNNYQEFLQGLICDDGYIDSSFLPETEFLAVIELMHLMTKNEAIYKEYIETKDNYKTTLDFLIQKLGYVTIKKEEDTFDIESGVVSPKVDEFLKKLTEKGLIDYHVENLPPLKR